MSDTEYSESEISDYESEDETKPIKRRLTRKLEVISENEFMCMRCKQKFSTRNIAYKHTRFCTGIQKEQNPLNKCMWCGLEFKNRGNLATHAYHIHGDTSYRTVAVSNEKAELFSCHVCSKSFKTHMLLRYHIRSQHFNLRARVPYAEFKKVNQIWFEKVQNTNKIVEIKKTGENKLIMRTLSENTGIKVNEVNSKVVDLRHIYPIEKAQRVMCNDCNRSYLKRDFKKHYEERHLNKLRHICNNCNRTFKRSYLYIKHKCTKSYKVKGVHHNRNADQNQIRISSVESLSVPL